MVITTLRFVIISAMVFAFELASAQIPNNGFELWSTDPSGNLNPVGWETTNDDTDISVEQYTPAKEGAYSMRVKTFDPGFMPISGFATAFFPLTERPTVFTGWVKATVMPGDAAYVIVSLLKGDSIVAAADSCTFIIDSTINEYVHFSFPLYYQSTLTPDSANIMIVAGKFGGAALGTSVIVDELAFGQGVGTGGTRISESAFSGPAYPNPATDRVFLPLTLEHLTNVEIEISDLRGNRVQTIRCGQLETGQHTLELPLNELPEGQYIYNLSAGEYHSSGKLTILK